MLFILIPTRGTRLYSSLQGPLNIHECLSHYLSLMIYFVYRPLLNLFFLLISLSDSFTLVSP